MKRFLRYILCVLMLGHLVSCTTHYPTTVKKHEVQQCLSLCAQRFDACQKTCIYNCSLCSAAANQKTILNYARYVHEEQVEGGFVTRGLKSYRDPLQCRKVTCNCYADLSVCKQNCTGIIHKQIRTVQHCS